MHDAAHDSHSQSQLKRNLAGKSIVMSAAQIGDRARVVSEATVLRVSCPKGRNSCSCAPPPDPPPSGRAGGPRTWRKRQAGRQSAQEMQGLPNEQSQQRPSWNQAHTLQPPHLVRRTPERSILDVCREEHCVMGST